MNDTANYQEAFPPNGVTFGLDVSGHDETPWQVQSITLSEGLNRVPSCVVEARRRLPVSVDDLLGRESRIHLSRGEAMRSFSGIVWHARVHDERDWVHVELHLVAALQLLTQRSRSRIFQGMSLPEIIEQVYLERVRDTGRQFKSSLQETYHPREYVVQYQESDLAFISRLAEEAGVFWHFEHDDDLELLVLSDSTSGLSTARSSHDGSVLHAHPDAVERDAEVAWGLAHEQRIGASAVVVGGYDWTQPRLTVRGEAHGGEVGSLPGLEVYDHTDAVTLEEFDGQQYRENSSQRQARLRAELLDLSRQSWRMSSTVLAVGAGSLLEVSGCDDPQLDQRYLVVAMTAQGSPTAQGEGGLVTNSLTLVPASMRYRPARRTARPSVHGFESATVVGDEGAEIHTDRFGRVRVHFHWDRENPRSAADSSCWIRVMQGWAGPGFGTFFLPRVGMEVLVAFIAGDLDRPIVAGTVYNGLNHAGVDLPAKKTQSLIRTKSSPNSDGFNELRFEDEAGSEFIYTHAQKDYNEEVEHDHSTHVKNNQSNSVDVNQTETVGNDQRMTVHNDRFHTVDNDEWVEIGHYRSEIVHGNEDWVIEGQRARTVQKDELLTVQEGDRKIHVQTGKDLETFDGGREVKVKAFDNLKVLDGANRNEHITGQYNVTVDGAHYTLVQGGTEKITQGSEKTYVESAKEVHAKTGSSHLLMKNDGKIKLAGDTKIELEVGGCKIEMTTEKITLSAGSSSIELGPSGVTTSGSKVTSSAQTMNEITGLLVKIN